MTFKMIFKWIEKDFTIKQSGIEFYYKNAFKMISSYKMLVKML